MVPDLLTRFGTKEGYNLYPDVLPFFIRLSDSAGSRTVDEWSSITVGIITNSDDRVPGVLESFGLLVGNLRYGDILKHDQQKESRRTSNNDIDFVIMSYDVDCEKPDPAIFDAAVIASGYQKLDKVTKIYVGDDYKKDIEGARNAGWQPVWLRRDSEGSLETNTSTITTLDCLL